MEMDPRPRLGAWGALLGMLAAGAAVFVLEPGKTAWLPPCPFHWLTGLYCPGCGTLRGLRQLLHGSLIGAWRCNPLMVLCLPLLAYAVLSLAAAALGRTVRPITFPVPVSRLTVFVIIGYAILRNVPVYPLTLLAPR